MKKSFSCFVIGADSLLIESCEILLAKGQTIHGIISATPRIVEWARGKGIAVFDSQSDYPAKLRSQPFDYLFSITHLAILPDEVIGLPRKGAINFHDGPLPRYAGLNAPVWALLHQESNYGITWHWMTAHIDQGDILKQRCFEMAPGETALSLNTRCFEAGIETFSELVNELADGTVTSRKQDLGEHRYCGKYDRPAAACVLDWSRSAEELEALVRALDFGRYDNPVGVAKVRIGNEGYVVTRVSVEGEPPAKNEPAGTVLGAGADGIRVATGDGTLLLTGLSDLCGREVSIADAVKRTEIRPGRRLDSLTGEAAESLTKLNGELCRSESFWVRRLAKLEPIELPQAKTGGCACEASQRRHEKIHVPRAFVDRLKAGGFADGLTSAFGLFLAKIGQKNRFHLAFSDSALRKRIGGFEAWVSARVPLQIEVTHGDTFDQAVVKLGDELKEIRRRGTWLTDVVARFSELRVKPELGEGRFVPIGVEQRSSLGGGELEKGLQLALAISEADAEARLEYDTSVFSAAAVASLAGQFTTFLNDIAARPGKSLTDLDVLSEMERKRLLSDWNATDVPYRKDACVHQLIEEQVARTPDATALVFEDSTLTYRELDERANQLAAYLRSLGVVPDRLVGVNVERSLDLMVATLGVMKAGGAYVPLDPSFPTERIAFMIEDSKAAVILTQSHLVAELPKSSAQVVRIDADWPMISSMPRTPSRSAVQSSNLAYVIYTSGSTGKPKGVMVEHRNVVNFFAGMDEKIPHDPAGTWLAVTTLSFDISVLELFWTLSHGFKVVLFVDRDRESKNVGASRSDRSIDFSLFFWGNDDGPGSQKYELLLESARFGDANGFSAVWTPERHFHAFGGPYPNPSVIGAAVAAITSRIQIRAGSCVLPLHHPIRVAEEWAVIDNLSNGRVGISFASGWQPHDFVIRPEGYKDNKANMFRELETVRKLWRGESIAFRGPFGDMIERTTLPRPVQKELPTWITTAGNPETYQQAGAIRANLLTHLLGQSVEEVAEKIRLYREARAANGHDPAAGCVTLMLHTFVGENEEEVRGIVREPMKSYLKSSLNLLKQFAWTFPAFKRPGGADTKPDDLDLSGLSAEEMDGILEHAFARYFETSGLFGTPQSCFRMIEKLKAIGVDEVGCLIDFGVPTKTVLQSLPHLNALKQLSIAARRVESANGQDFSFAAMTRRHPVTHMQCTPSMARMLLMNEETREAFGSIPQLFIGGEACPPSLARELQPFSKTTVTNMYGPTETTVWSTTHRLNGELETIPIGRPIANTRLYILDSNRRPVPPGVPGELSIGGDGVVRAYLHRPELTAERFVPDEFCGIADARMYRTGDLARYREDGVVEFLGRNDFQVKIRGYRIELGEIESVLTAHEAVREAVVMAREDAPGDVRLVAYLVAKDMAPSPAALRDALRSKLPEYMLPGHYVFLDRLPLTPNGKVDRKALPAPQGRETKASVVHAAPVDDLEKTIAGLWRETLAVQEIGTDDNFFDIGGHSLLVVKMHRRMKEMVEHPVALTDLYRFPTIRSFAGFLRSGGVDGRIKQSADRAQLRKDAMQRRRGVRTV
ncbi:MAG: MupA/Atu3671 family FMN-dependent luciferase-like monooxygenase [Planctomycetota bacterium]